MANPWQGEVEFKAALQELCRVRSMPPHSQLVQNVVALAFKFQSEFKMVVFHIEKWIKSCANMEERMAGMFVIDEICRNSRARAGKEKDLYPTRFQLRIAEILSLMLHLPDHCQMALVNLLEDWVSIKLFSEEKLAVILQNRKLTSSTTTLKHKDPRSKSKHAPSSNEAQASAPVPADPRLKSSKSMPTPPASAQEAHVGSPLPASGAHRNASNIAQPNSATGTGNHDNDDNDDDDREDYITPSLEDLVGPKRNIRYCAFRDGNCPMGDKCRYSHADERQYYPTTVASGPGSARGRKRPRNIVYFTSTQLLVLKAADNFRIQAMSTSAASSDSDAVLAQFQRACVSPDSICRRVFIKNNLEDASAVRQNVRLAPYEGVKLSALHSRDACKPSQPSLAHASDNYSNHKNNHLDNNPYSSVLTGGLDNYPRRMF